MRKIFFRITKDMFPQMKDRYPYVYLEHGRLEIDDSSVKWISAEGYVVRLPVAVIGSVILGPGTSVTHAAIESISSSGCSVCWVGEDSLTFYAYGMPPTADTQNFYKQGRLAFNPLSRLKVARRMFSKRFPNAELLDKSLQVMMGMEGQRVKRLNAEKSEKYNVPWNSRSYIPGQPAKSDPVNRCLTFFNGLLYGILTSVILYAGYSPRIGFIHSGSPMPFVYDVADLYKEWLTIDLAFSLVANDIDVFDKRFLIDAFCNRVVEYGLMGKVVLDIEEVMDIDEDDSCIF